MEITFTESRAKLATVGLAGEILPTPGHSDDSVSLLLDDGSVFTGDLTIPMVATDEQRDAIMASWRLLLTSYANRRRHWPGDREFRFQLSAPIPPDVAAALVNSIGKPAVNGDPDPGAPSFAMIPARHRTRTGGTNGVLRFGQDGIDYIASPGDGGRSWRWADIETLASPDPYHFRVGDLFGQLWDRVYARDLNVTRPGGEQHADQ